MTKWLQKVRSLSLVLACLPLVGLADDFTVDWHRIGQGGGTSTSDEFTISGIIGEPVAGESSAGEEFTVTGGVGVITVLPTEGVPSLAISSAADGTVLIYWPLPDDGWELRQSVGLAGTAWEKPTEPLQEDGTFRFIAVTPAAGARFYRLVAADTSVPDQDGDGIPDDREAEFGFDPQLADTDRDGVPDGLEDAEGDGLPNAWELRQGFNPLARDSDGDGFNDEAEVTAGSAPLDFSNRPRPMAASGSAAEVLRPAVQMLSASVIGGDVTVDVLRPALPRAGQAGPIVVGTPQVSVEPQ